MSVNTCRIVVNNVMSKSSHTILIGGSLSDSILTNIVRHGSAGDAVTVASGPQYVRDITITNVHVIRWMRPPWPTWRSVWMGSRP
jgi:hypothetical protein